MMKVSDMPKVSREEVGANIDYYSERVNHEGIAFLITDEGKPDLVFCSAWWFCPQADHTFKYAVKSAVRGAIHEDGQEVAEVVSFVWHNLDVIETEAVAELISYIEQELTSPDTIPYVQERQSLVTGLKERLQGLRDRRR